MRHAGGGLGGTERCMGLACGVGEESARAWSAAIELTALCDDWSGQFDDIQHKLCQARIATRSCLHEYVEGRTTQTAGQTQGRSSGQL